MELPGWVMLSTILWIFGYVKSKFGELTDGELVLIPTWVYVVICGFPSSKDLPKNTVLVVGLRFQIAGWLMILYALFLYRTFTNELLGFVIGLVGSLLMSMGLADIFKRDEDKMVN